MICYLHSRISFSKLINKETNLLLEKIDNKAYRVSKLMNKNMKKRISKDLYQQLQII